MVKLILCDVDGTLLRYGETKIEPNVIDTIGKLIQKGIRFVPASGRQYSSLLALFADVPYDLCYLCENGAILFDSSGRVIDKSVIGRSVAMNLCRSILDTPGCEVLISGENTSYIIPKDPEYPQKLQTFTGNNIRIIGAPEEIDEDIIKISANCPSGLQRLTQVQEQLREAFEPDLHMAIAGSYWLDFTLTDKGTAADTMCSFLHIDQRDTAAIGDSFNDLPMLGRVGRPILMSNAPDGLKRLFPNQSESAFAALNMLLGA